MLDKILITNNHSFVPYGQGDMASACTTGADSSGDGIISLTELINFVEKWKAGDVWMTGLVDVIWDWKSGC